jgi:hypothetical protein
MLRFAPSDSGSVIASIQGSDAFHSFQRSQLMLDRATGAVVKWEPYNGNSTGRKLRTWVRGLHGLHIGEAFGFASQTAAKLDLELVLTTANGKSFLLLFFNAPLPTAELTIIGPSKWEKPLATDEQGRITLPTPWAGRYVLEVTYFDEKPGRSGEQKFSRTRHIASLSFVQQTGQRWTDKR